MIIVRGENIKPYIRKLVEEYLYEYKVGNIERSDNYGSHLRDLMLGIENLENRFNEVIRAWSEPIILPKDAKLEEIEFPGVDALSKRLDTLSENVLHIEKDLQDQIDGLRNNLVLPLQNRITSLINKVSELNKKVDDHLGKEKGE